MIDPVLSIKNLSVSLRRDGESRVVLENLSLNVFPGEIVGILGESGSGKSTLGAAIQGLLPEVSEPVVCGSINLNKTELVGADASVLRRTRRHVVRSIPQDPMSALNPTMSIRDQMRESVKCGDGDILEWLETVGLEEAQDIARAFPYRLSGGQRQRVAIAMAMMARPMLLIADEPTTALDFELQSEIFELIQTVVRQQAASSLFITHNLDAAAVVCDRLLILRNGKIVEVGSRADILDRPRHHYTRQLVEARRSLIDDTRIVTTRSEREERLSLRMSNVVKGFSNLSLFGRRERRSEVLRGFDLEISPGECVGLLGPSGSGKSTVVRIAAGLLSSDEGRVEWGDGDRPQVVFQDAVASLTPWLTVAEQVGERLRPLRLSASERRARVSEVMSLVGLDERCGRELPGRLSVGQCQRAVIARAVIVPPRLLLCDEPTSSLDASLATTILDLIGDLRRRLNIGVLFVTHDLSVAGYVADRIALLSEGRVVSQGEPKKIIDSLSKIWARTGANGNANAEASPL
ncbi:ABC transporter ATP-binding protein [Rhizobium sp. GCM10022189]|uniref:ABC transporter ATP-binding protein n=1 Tax=Rhizobium sp. GCM10022189 TaxID=3252654 RepID=UPI00361E91CA